MDHMNEWAECVGELGELVKQEKIVYKEHVVKGIDSYVDTVNLLFDGRNNGKLMIEV